MFRGMIHLNFRPYKTGIPDYYLLLNQHGFNADSRFLYLILFIVLSHRVILLYVLSYKFTTIVNN